MDAKRTFAAVIVGAAVLYGVGYLLFNMLFASFYAANAGTATGVDRDSQIFWALAVGYLAYAYLIVFALRYRPNAALDGNRVRGRCDRRVPCLVYRGLASTRPTREPRPGLTGEPDLLGPAAVAYLAYAYLIVFALRYRPNAGSMGTGFLVGATVGFLAWFMVDFIFYGISNIQTLTRTIVDPLLELVHAGIAGAVIAAIRGSGAPPAA